MVSFACAMRKIKEFPDGASRCIAATPAAPHHCCSRPIGARRIEACIARWPSQMGAGVVSNNCVCAGVDAGHIRAPNGGEPSKPPMTEQAPVLWMHGRDLRDAGARQLPLRLEAGELLGAPYGDVAAPGPTAGPLCRLVG